MKFKKINNITIEKKKQKNQDYKNKNYQKKNEFEKNLKIKESIN